ncbi:MAG: type II toxin-antitoxin system VapB family antitoxin [Sporichthyaceae bacterium]
MALSIKDPATDQLVRALAQETGESITQAVTIAVAERLERIRGSAIAPDLTAELLAIGQRVRALPILDARTPEEILGYDEHGLPS